MGQIVRESNNPRQALKIHNSVSLRKDLSKYEKIELHKNILVSGGANSEKIHVLGSSRFCKEWRNIYFVHLGIAYFYSIIMLI